MIRHFDPRPFFEWFESVRYSLVPPGNQSGAVIVRERGQERITVGVGESVGRYFVSYVDSASNRPVEVREVSFEEYRDLYEPIDKPEYKSIGGVSEGDLLDGESYLVKYVEQSGAVSVVFINNPRRCQTASIAALTKALENIIEAAR